MGWGEIDTYSKKFKNYFGSIFKEREKRRGKERERKEEEERKKKEKKHRQDKMGDGWGR